MAETHQIRGLERIERIGRIEPSNSNVQPTITQVYPRLHTVYLERSLGYLTHYTVPSRTLSALKTKLLVWTFQNLIIKAVCGIELWNHRIIEW